MLIERAHGSLSTIRIKAVDRNDNSPDQTNDLFSAIGRHPNVKHVIIANVHLPGTGADLERLTSPPGEDEQYPTGDIAAIVGTPWHRLLYVDPGSQQISACLERLAISPGSYGAT